MSHFARPYILFCKNCAVEAHAAFLHLSCCLFRFGERPMESVQLADAAGVPVPPALRRRAVVTPSAPTEELVSSFLLSAAPAAGLRGSDGSTSTWGEVGTGRQGASSGGVKGGTDMEGRTTRSGASALSGISAMDSHGKSWHSAGSRSSHHQDGWLEDPDLDLDEVKGILLFHWQGVSHTSLCRP